MKTSYSITKEKGDSMFTTVVTDKYGFTTTNYFESDTEAQNHVYWRLGEGCELLKLLREEKELVLGRAIDNCIKITNKNK